MTSNELSEYYSTPKENYKEIFKLKEMLKKAKIPFIFKEHNDFRNGYQILYPISGELCRCSIIEHSFSYGHGQDLLEIQGLLTEDEMKDDSVVGYLSAGNVFERIKYDYEVEVINGRPTSKAILVMEKKFELNLREDAKFILHEYKDKDGINYCLKDEVGNILLNIESSKMLGNRVVLMADSFRHKGFEVSVFKK